MLAQVDLRQAIHYVWYIVIAGLIFSLLWWLIGYCEIPAPFAKVARVVLAILAVMVLIGVLLSLAGVPIVRY